MKEQESIPSGKVQRAARFVATGAKMGGNYIKYWAKKTVNPETSRNSLDEDNARDVYQTLSELKGSALKVAQMLSMDRNLLPTAYADKFRMAQYNAPPLSYPLVVRTFTKQFGQGPDKLFDSFTKSAVNAASIGQVHKATANGKTFAVKVQYPGVAESVSSDLKLVKPVAMRIMNVKARDLDKYLVEVEERLLEETDYNLELQRSVQISELCSEIENVRFPKYYPDLSSDKILTMDWLEGKHLPDWLKTNPTQAERDRIGQALWDFYDFQIHKLKMVHADPHPGNFVVTPDLKLGVLDFGCVKVIPEDFYQTYFRLMYSDLLEDERTLIELLSKLDFLLPGDSVELRTTLTTAFKTMIDLLGRPFNNDTFDFGDDAYFNTIFAFGDEMSQNRALRSGGTARGSRHGIYVNRTYFGLYNILHDIRAKVTTRKWNADFRKCAG